MESFWIWIIFSYIWSFCALSGIAVYTVILLAHEHLIVDPQADSQPMPGVILLLLVPFVNIVFCLVAMYMATTAEYAIYFSRFCILMSSDEIAKYEADPSLPTILEIMRSHEH